jgi:hypothetical protein
LNPEARAPLPAAAELAPRWKRASWLLFLLAALFYLLLGRAHFSGTDEVAQFEMTRAIAERGALDVGPLMHTEVGRGGERYSFFAVGQAILALPLFAAADLAERLLPHSWGVALAGPALRDGRHVYGGDLAHTFVMFYPALAGALLVLLFFRFELFLGVRPTTAVGVALLFATTTHTAILSTYFLRHGTVACALLAAFLCVFRWREGGPPRALWTGAGLASSIPLVRVPAAIVGPAFGAYLAHAVYVRSEWSPRRALQSLAIALVPLVAALLVHMAFNWLKWEAWLESPMVGQRAEFSNPLWVGVRGFLFSPGLSVFVYSPLLLLAPFGMRELWRRWPAECVAFLGVAVSLLLFHSKFDRWTGLWSAPGPRYLFLAVPILMLPLGLWIDAGQKGRRWLAVVPLAAAGFFVQVVTSGAAWTQVPRLAGYPAEPDTSDFLLQVGQSPVVVTAQLLFEGRVPLDPWLCQLARGWPLLPGQPAAAWLLFTLLLLAVAVAGGLLWRACAPPGGESVFVDPLANADQVSIGVAHDEVE